MRSKRNMNNLQRQLSACLLATAALLGGTSAAWADVPLGAASPFSALGASVTCTTSAITGDVGISPAIAFTNTGCTINGAMPPATDIAAAQASTDFLGAYDAARNTACTNSLLSTITGPITLTPGVYCTDADLTATGVLTLDAQGNPNAVWVFKIGLETGALTGTNFSVVMAGGGQACNVVWAPGAGVTMTTSTMVGNILAGNAIDGAITLTGGSLQGRALANVAVTMTDTSVTGCGALPPPPPSCKSKKYCKYGDDCKDDKDHGDDEHHGDDKDYGDDKDHEDDEDEECEDDEDDEDHDDDDDEDSGHKS